MKNKLHETGTDFEKDLSVTKINSNGFSTDSYMPKEFIGSISRAYPEISKQFILELLEKIIAQYEYDMLHSNLDKILTAFSNQTKAEAFKSTAERKLHLTIESKPIIDMCTDCSGGLWAITETRGIRKTNYDENCPPERRAYIFYKLIMPAKELPVQNSKSDATAKSHIENSPETHLYVADETPASSSASISKPLKGGTA